MECGKCGRKLRKGEVITIVKNATVCGDGEGDYEPDGGNFETFCNECCEGLLGD
jgi:hypothetical protein